MDFYDMDVDVPISNLVRLVEEIDYQDINIASEYLKNCRRVLYT